MRARSWLGVFTTIIESATDEGPNPNLPPYEIEGGRERKDWASKGSSKREDDGEREDKINRLMMEEGGGYRGDDVLV